MRPLLLRSAIVGAGVVVALGAAASARPIFPSDVLPPPTGHYVNLTDSISYLGGFVIVNNVDHFAFSNSFPPPTGLGTSFDNFNSLMNMDLSVNSGPFMPLQANAFANVRVTHTGTIGAVSTFDTEMLGLSISGGSLPAGAMIRESPTLASLGQTTITNVGGGLFQIDSFFDIFTELSLDGGQTWTPGTSSSGGAEHVRLIIPTPPGALCLLGLGLIATRRRRA